MGRKIKTKIYLDTSVISYLMHEDSPEKMASTHKLWEQLTHNDNFDIFISNVTLAELSECYEEKRIFMQNKLNEISFTLLETDIETENLAKQIIQLGILTNKSYDDCLHIAIAVMHGCSYIVSWNFKHLVNIKTIKGVRAIATLKGFNSIDIITPEMMIKGESNE